MRRSEGLQDRAEGRPAVLYARVSSAEQEKEGFSIPAQLKALQAYAASNGLRIVREFVDVETAKQAGRTQFDLMGKFLLGHPDVKVVLVEKTDRLYRNFRDYVTLDDLGKEIHLVKENEIISKASRSHQKFIHGIKLLMAKNFIDNLSEEVRKGMTEKVARGEYPHQAPVGYLNDRLHRTIVIDADKAPFVRTMFEWYASGQYSLEDLRKRAVAAGFRPTKVGSRPISKSMVEWILKNPFYTGLFRWKREIYRGNHEPIISQELFDKVAAVFRSHGRRRGKGRVHTFAFGGLMTCGRCGCAIVAEIKKAKYVYYHCTNRRGECDRKNYREETLQGQFADVVRGIVIDADTAEWMKEALRESMVEETALHQQEVARLTRQVEEVKRRLHQAYVDKLDGKITDEFWAQMSSEWQVEQARLTSGLSELQKADRLGMDDGVKLLELSQRAPQLYLTQEPSEKLNFLKVLCSNFTLTDGNVTPIYRQPFDVLALTAGKSEENPAREEARISKMKNWYPRQDSNLRLAD